MADQNETPATTARMTTAGHVRALSALGFPLVGGHVAQFAIGMTDSVMLGWYGAEALAAVTLAGSYFFVFFLLGAGFAIAVMPLVAAADGAGGGASDPPRDPHGAVVVAALRRGCDAVFAVFRNHPFGSGSNARGGRPGLDLSTTGGLGAVSCAAGDGAEVLPRSAGTDPDRALDHHSGRSGEWAGQLCADLWQLGRTRAGYPRRGHCLDRDPSGVFGRCYRLCAEGAARA